MEVKKTKMPIATIKKRGETVDDFVKRIISTTLENIKQDLNNYTFDNSVHNVSIDFEIEANKIMTYSVNFEKYVYSVEEEDGNGEL